ncbi:MAG: AraC family transcriptional regulator [Clostridium sp.]
MTKILVIAENRKHVRSICDFLKNYDDIFFQIVYYSTNAFDAFIFHKPDVVIIDSKIMIPINSLLKEFKQYKWHFRVIILGSIVEENQLEGLDIVLVENSDIQRVKEAILCFKVEEISIIENTDENFSQQNNYINPDFYYIMRSKYTGEGDIIIDEDNFNQLQQHIETIATPEVCNNDGQDIYIMIKKSNIRVSNPNPKIHRMIQHYLDPSYSSLYFEKVPWNQVDEKYIKLIELSKYCYFLQGECKIAENLQKNIRVSSFEENYEKIIRLLKYTIDENYTQIKGLLKKVYFDDIKNKYDFIALSNIREGIQFCEELFSKMLGRECKTMKLQENSLEDEYNKVVRYFTQILTQIHLKKISPFICEAFLYVFQHYSEELSLESMADKLCISKIHLSRIFKSQTNMTFLEFIQNLRIFIAKQYLSEDTYRINEIAEKIGYIDAHYFTKVFKKHTGYSPKEFRGLVYQERIKDESSYQG